MRPGGRHVQAVVFDFDGVIADSMPQHAEAYRRVLAPYGVEVRDETVFRHEGARSETILRDLLEEAGTTLGGDDLRRLADEKQEVFRSLGRPRIYDGAVEAVEQVMEATQDVGLVTGTRRENLEALIPELLPRFRAVLAQADYTRDKPDPEPYAKAAERLGVAPGGCLAVENAVRGVESARNAGYGAVVAIATTMQAEDLEQAGADEVAPDHATLAQRILERLANGP